MDVFWRGVVAQKALLGYILGSDFHTNEYKENFVAAFETVPHLLYPTTHYSGNRLELRFACGIVYT